MLDARLMVQFSVIIPTYNRRERVLRAVRTVLAQRFSSYEIVVVDDGSTDGTFEARRRLRGPVRTVRQQNVGPAAARTAPSSTTCPIDIGAT